MASIYKTFADGDAFTAADANTYLMRQTIIACDNQTDRDAILTPQEGMTVYRKDTDATEVYDGSAWLSYDSKWQSYTPALTNITLGNGTLTARYFRTGKKCAVAFSLDFGTTTGMGTDPSIALPFTSAALITVANLAILGAGNAYDNSAGQPYYVAVEHGSTTLVTVRAWATNGTFLVPQVMGSATPFIWAVNDDLAVNFEYQMA